MHKKGKNTSKEYELVFQKLDELSSEIRTLKRPESQVVGFLDFVVRLATVPPRADGHLQASEILTGVSLTVGSWAVGAFGSEITGDPGITQFATRLGVYGCLALWTMDVVNPAGIWEQTFGRALDSFGERLAELTHRPVAKRPVRLLPITSSNKPKKEIVFDSEPEEEYDLTDDLSISIKDMLGFVTTAARLNDWTRSGWCGGDSKGGRGMPQPLWYALRDELKKFKVWEKGLDSPALRAFIHSFDDPIERTEPSETKRQ